MHHSFHHSIHSPLHKPPNHPLCGQFTIYTPLLSIQHFIYPLIILFTLHFIHECIQGFILFPTQPFSVPPYARPSTLWVHLLHAQVYNPSWKNHLNLNLTEGYWQVRLPLYHPQQAQARSNLSSSFHETPVPFQLLLDITLWPVRGKKPSGTTTEASHQLNCPQQLLLTSLPSVLSSYWSELHNHVPL